MVWDDITREAAAHRLLAEKLADLAKSKLVANS